MKNDSLHEELTMLISSTLELDCPVLSGNMSSHINMEELGENFARISISGPSYDLKEYRNTGRIVYTNRYDYAISVNEVGAFLGRSIRSRHWANKSVVKACRAIANRYNAEVIVNVEL